MGWDGYVWRRAYYYYAQDRTKGGRKARAPGTRRDGRMNEGSEIRVNEVR